MRVDHRLQAHPAALGGRGEPKGDLAGALITFSDAIDQSGLQVSYRHHADCLWRRPKTNAELRRDLEFVELAARRRR